MFEDKLKNQPEPEKLTDCELDNVAGGMQKQLNNNSTTGHAGGVNSKENFNPAKVQILCNELGKKG